MKKIQCTSCSQVFWTDLQIDEALISAGEWVQNPCPKCGAKWAVVEPAAVVRGRRGRKPGPKRRGRPTKAIQAKGERTPAKDKAPGFSPAGIRRLRKKLGVTQTKFASLVGVSTGTVVGWESGKFKPRGKKIAELSDLEKWDKADAQKVMEEKEAKQPTPEKPAEEEKPAETIQPEIVEEPKVMKAKGKRGGRGRKGGRRRREGKKK